MRCAGGPGAFVRASQDLNQALLDRSRLDRFVAEIQQPSPADPDRLTRIAPQLAQSLVIKLDPACLEKMPDLQSACLMQNQDALVLSDGHSSAISDALTGPGANLALDLSWTPQGGLGSYSPYIGAVRDLIGIFSSIHTAKYQYIAGLNIEQADRIDLFLNTAPSFHNPKSVLVVGAPGGGPAPLAAAPGDGPGHAGMRRRARARHAGQRSAAGLLHHLCPSHGAARARRRRTHARPSGSGGRRERRLRRDRRLGQGWPSSDRH